MNNKVAIIHDHFLHFGGAERVLLTFIKMFPNAHIYMALGNKALIDKYLPKNKVILSYFQKLIYIDRSGNFFKPFLFYYWKNINLSEYDLVISSSHSFSSKSVIVKNRTKHISYIYTPPRYLYEEYNETRWIRLPIIKLLLTPIILLLRKFDFKGAQEPRILITDSKNVQKRIKKYYNRKSTVIYPPVNTSTNISYERKKEYYLFISRLVKQKGAELAINTFNQLKLPLVVIGEGAEGNSLKLLANSNIIFKGFVSENELSKIYLKARALIYCAIDEDFGIVPVEAMAHGVPVVAYNSGGVRETVIPNKTGILFNQYNPKSLQFAINKLQTTYISPKYCKNWAKNFSEKKFEIKFRKIINN